MLEPLLPEHLAEFRRLQRLQLWTIPVVPMVAGLLAALVMIPFQTPTWVNAMIMIPLLGATAVFVVWLEVRKFLVFRRDLHERKRQMG
jgi:hypothetical protein